MEFDLTIVSGALAALLFWSAAVERFTELVLAPVIDRKPEFKPYIIYGTLGFGVLVAFGFGVDSIGPLMESFGVSPPVSWAGTLATGLVIGAGSNFIHDIWPGSTARSK